MGPSGCWGFVSCFLGPDGAEGGGQERGDVICKWGQDSNLAIWAGRAVFSALPPPPLRLCSHPSLLPVHAQGLLLHLEAEFCGLTIAWRPPFTPPGHLCQDPWVHLHSVSAEDRENGSLEGPALLYTWGEPTQDTLSHMAHVQSGTHKVCGPLVSSETPLGCHP